MKKYKHQLPIEGNHVSFGTEYRGEAVSFPEINPWVSLSENGVMTFRPGYSWDGATLFPDFKWIRFPSLVHDGFYQLMREKALTQKSRNLSDKGLRDDCKDNGGPSFLCVIVYLGVRAFGWLFSRKWFK